MTVTKIDLGVEYLGGIAKPAAADVGKFAVVRLDSLSRPNLAYETQVATVADDTFASTLAPFLRGVGLTVDSSGNLKTLPRPRRAVLVDHFFGGNATSGSIGSLGWSLLGSGTPAAARGNITTSLLSERLVLSTSASTNDRTTLALGSSESLKIAIASQCELLQFAIRPQSLANVRFFVGLQGDLSSNPTAATTALGLMFDSGVHATHYHTLARVAGVGSPTDTGFDAVTAAGALVTLQQTSSGVIFYVGNTALGTVLNASIPTAVANLGVRIETLTSATKSLSVSHFTGVFNLGDANDDDAFLEA